MRFNVAFLQLISLRDIAAHSSFQSNSDPIAAVRCEKIMIHVPDSSMIANSTRREQLGDNRLMLSPMRASERIHGYLTRAFIQVRDYRRWYERGQPARQISSSLRFRHSRGQRLGG
jgi:hypothetical protein